jgi:SH3-like domain-containing protein
MHKMIPINLTAIVVLLSVAFGAMTEAGQIARVLADRVNLRARPVTSSEVVGQVSEGETLEVVSIDDQWAEIIPPPRIDAWVASEFVVDGQVVVSKLNARSGAGINYNVIGTFAKNDRVTRRGSFGEWLKVAPPSDARLYVSREFLDLMAPDKVTGPASVVPPTLAPPIELQPAVPLAQTDNEANVPPPVRGFEDMPAADAEMVAVEGESEVAAPRDLRLIPLDGQGRVVQREGQLKKVPLLFFNPPGTHRLVKREGNKIITTAYLRGNKQQLDALVDHYLLISGNEYWTEDVKQPLIVIRSIEKRAFY